MVVSTKEEIISKLVEGDRRRATASTNMNKQSSRSHAIFRLTVESRDIALGSKSPITKSQLNLVDLAGSEKASQTGASGQTLKEGIAINKSLLMLGRVINELTQGAGHISYRDSVLTRILQPALGGNAKTAIIATATRANVVETKSTLLFADGAKKMKNKVRQNESMGKDALIHRQAEEIKQLRLQLESQPTGQSTDEVDELQARIKQLQKLIINKRDDQPMLQPTKKPTRRHTFAPGMQKSAPIQRAKLAKLEEDEWTEGSADILDRLDQDRELRQIDLNRSNEKKRARLDSSINQSPTKSKRHKSMINPNHEAITFLDEIDFEKLNKENFDELKKKVRKSVFIESDEQVDELKESLNEHKQKVADLEQQLAKASISSEEASFVTNRLLKSNFCFSD